MPHVRRLRRPLPLHLSVDVLAQLQVLKALASCHGTLLPTILRPDRHDPYLKRFAVLLHGRSRSGKVDPLRN